MAIATRAHPATCACCRTDAVRLLRRPLTYAETHIDVEVLTAALDATKARLHALIAAEQARVARRVNLDDPRPVVIVTRAMLAALVELRDLGRREAIREAASMGVILELPRHVAPGLVRTFASRPQIQGSIPEGVGRPALTLAGHLARFSDRLRFEAIKTRNTRIPRAERAGKIGGVFDARAIMARAIVNVPGALDAAGRVVSMTLAGGMADVFAANADAFDGWQYTAVLDAATCEVCEGLDGTEYPTWDDAQRDLPDGGPNPECYGENRCRCRLVPIPAGQGGAPELPPEPPPEPEPAAPFSGAIYDALGPGLSLDGEGVVGGTGRVLDHARADHETIVKAGAEIRDEISRRVEALEPRASTPNPAIARARAAEQSALLDVDVALEQSGGVETPAVAGARKRLAARERDLARAETKPELHYVRGEDIARVEREVLEERGVTFATTGELDFKIAPSVPGHIKPLPIAAQKDLAAAAEQYPRAWIDASNANPNRELTVGQYAAKMDEGRSAHYPETGVIAMSKRAVAARDANTYAHELAHRLEASVAAIRRAERTLFEWRARGRSWDGERELAQPLGFKPLPGQQPEMAIFDDWVNRYSGKAYGSGDARAGAFGPAFRTGEAFEILTMAVGERQSLAKQLLRRDTLGRSTGERAIYDDRELSAWLYGLMLHVR